MIRSIRWLPAVLAISGAVNIAGEAVWFRFAGLLAGDFYKTYALVSCAFILGSATGALAGAWKPRLVWILELAPAAWTAYWGWRVAHGLLSDGMAQWAAISLILIPAIALGAHAPAYAAALRKARHAAVSATYHLGGIAGLLALAFLAPHGWKLSTEMLALGLVQASLAVLLLAAGASRIPDAERNAVIGLAALGRPVERGAFLVGTFGFAWTMCAYSEAVFLSYPIRPVQFAMFASSIAWIAAGGAASRLFAKAPSWLLPALLGASTIAAVACAKALAPHLLPQSGIPGFTLSMLFIGGILSAPVGITSAWYGIAADRMASLGHGQAWGGGRIWAFAGLGNAAGCILAMVHGEDTIPVLGMAAMAAMPLAMRLRGKNLIVPIVIAAILGIANAAYLRSGAWRDFPARQAELWPSRGKPESLAMARHGLWWHGIDIHPGPMGGTTTSSATFTIDGHESHDLAAGDEFIFPMLPALYFDRLGTRRSLLIGLGSGQSAWAAAHLSQEGVDVVDISPAAPHAAKFVAAYNDDVMSDPKMRLIQGDAIAVLRACAPGSYNAIMDGPTPPALMNSFKLYTTEFVAAAKRCLAPGGVFMTYYSQHAGWTPELMEATLGAVARNFDHADVTEDPYPAIIAYDGATKSPRKNLSADLFDGPEAQAYAVTHAPLVFLEANGKTKNRIPVRRIVDWKPSTATPPASMDDLDFEAAHVGYYLRARSPGWQASPPYFDPAAPIWK